MTFSNTWLSASWVGGVTQVSEVWGHKSLVESHREVWEALYWLMDLCLLHEVWGKHYRSKSQRQDIFRASYSFPQQDHPMLVYQRLRYKLLSSSYYKAPQQSLVWMEALPTLQTSKDDGAREQRVKWPGMQPTMEQKTEVQADGGEGAWVNKETGIL